MIAVHVACSLLSYVAFLVAFVSGWLFLIQERQVRRKTLGALFHRLPSLATLDRLNFRSLGFGFALLSLGLLFGFVGMRVSFGRWWMPDPKLAVAVAVWCAYLLLWMVRLRSALRGRRVAILSILGFSLLLLTWWHTSYLLRSAHPYL
ncbi:MAG: cytochrome c biogenesis protein CcsA [Candidatus Omnitrophica bacterium]|nr:cytochrome c biogenesis protein CcsA [Candidatus Omnitrophota bacterium]